MQLQPPGLLVYLAEGRAESNSDCQLWLRMTDGAIDGHCSLIIAEEWLTFINYIFITTLNDEFPQIPRDKVRDADRPMVRRFQCWVILFLA